MTNKSLSQQICEVCGIEPKGKLVFEKRNWDKKTWLSAGVEYKQFDFESTPNVTVDIIPTEFYNEKNGFQYPYSRIDEIKKLYDKNGYDFIEFAAKFIDFENNNNNFVKLINIIYACGINQKYDYQLATLSFEEDSCYWFEENSNTFQKRYLEVLLYTLSKNYDSWDVKFQNIIKQAIKNEQWEV